MHMTGSTPFGDRLKQARKERGMSPDTFAARVGVATCQVTGYENRGRQPRLDTLIAIAQVLDCSLDWLVGLSEN